MSSASLDDRWLPRLRLCSTFLRVLTAQHFPRDSHSPGHSPSEPQSRTQGQVEVLKVGRVEGEPEVRGAVEGEGTT